MASSKPRNFSGGSGSKNASSLFTGPPLRAADQPPKLCATKRRVPIARPAASRWSVPSVRRRLVVSKKRSMWRMSNSPDSAVSWCTITSGSADATAWATESGSRASATAGRAPRLRTRSCFDALLVIPTTSWPRATSCGTSRLPRTPVAPATKIFMVAPLVYLPLRRDRGAARDRTAARLGLEPAQGRLYDVRAAARTVIGGYEVAPDPERVEDQAADLDLLLLGADGPEQQAQVLHSPVVDAP